MAKILLIEDEPTIREEVLDWLQFEGYEALGAPNGRLGLEVIQRDHPDLILCDIAMPEMDGHEVLLEVRASMRFSSTPFVFLTASADREAIRRGMDMGADDYLTKPFSHAELLNMVRSRLRKKELQEEVMLGRIQMLDAALAEEREQRLLKSRLVAMFSHDFRNPLTAIMASAELLDEMSDPQHYVTHKQKYVNRIFGSVYILLQMLDEVMVVAEMEGGHITCTPQMMDLLSFVEKIIEEFRLIDRNAHIFSLTYSLPEQIELDPRLLRHILANLIANAIKYSPVGSEIRLNLSLHHDQIWLEVHDQGIGIPTESLPYLYEPFHRAKNAKQIKGVGLGLSIVRECVLAHNGQIAVETQVNGGTMFKVVLPLVPIST
ncbi:hybrid sensor histidine kinase/response regulator [Candidatus Oscillochloris fontis]|uniref:hybrid sensor histidine kinase/response regulator n=1 Tax=Candidatus Oscillochloris fontis TaxID=2496868 RepID=UPI00101CDF8D|nr:ATP-binding protein [Candidatus Oscillochloris fontis]